MTGPTPRMDLADYVHELTRPHTVREHYEYQIGGRGTWYGQHHTVHAPSLLTQLATNDTHTGSAEDGSRSGYTSRPAARLDALDALALIDLQASRWITDMGEQPRSLDTADIVLQLHGLAASADEVTRREVARSVHRWWIRARIVTGWDSPAWHPDATCPRCSERGTLRVRLADHVGMCTYAGDKERGREACGATWDESNIGLLADHIRAESESKTRREGPGACWCPWPEPGVGDLAHMCPRCGSARCRHALEARLLADVGQVSA